MMGILKFQAKQFVHLPLFFSLPQHHAEENQCRCLNGKCYDYLCYRSQVSMTRDGTFFSGISTIKMGSALGIETVEM